MPDTPPEILPTIMVDGHQLIICPFCVTEKLPAYHNVHFKTPVYVNGMDAYMAWEGRGDLLVIPLYCESGHNWEVCLGHHKGETTLFSRESDD